MKEEWIVAAEKAYNRAIEYRAMKYALEAYEAAKRADTGSNILNVKTDAPVV